jgi:pimeloyl-ACP methyl ester carboxylesterase
MPDSTNTERKNSPAVNTQHGRARFVHTLTLSEQTDTVKLIMRKLHVLPIVFVPGVMGTNLKSNDRKNTQAWRVDSGLKTLQMMNDMSAGKRQKALHPDRTQVDPRGALPDRKVAGLISDKDFLARGWGEVSQESYHAFLIWMEEHLNGGNTHHSNLNAMLQKISDGAAWQPEKNFKPLNAPESKSAEQWLYPVYACGYNWLESNANSAKRLRDRIDAIIQENNRGAAVCEKVIVVTHSMGGLVARACCQLPVKEGGPKTMESKIVGVVHGVMPAIGAAAAYTRCKAGTQNDTPSGLIDGQINDWGAVRVIGKTGKEVTAVFAQSPGPLQLLPNKQYPKDWLQVRDSDDSLLPEQPDTSDPYEFIYKERKKWWGLIKEEWLSPPGGEELKWGTFELNVDKASKFHDAIQDYYHPNTWGFYGQGIGSYERAVWTLSKGNVPPSKDAPAKKDINHLPHSAMHEEGTSTIGVAAPDQTDWQLDGSTLVVHGGDYYYLRLPAAHVSHTGTGDGTVSAVSGRAPAASDKVKQLFCIRGISHEGCYRDSMDARHATVYAINKMAAPLPITSTKGKA